MVPSWQRLGGRGVEEEADFLIIGGGIAGACAAYALSRLGSVLLLEAEDQLAYHSTGRSAAFFAETYGGPTIQPLTAASKGFFISPPADFGDVSLTEPRGALHVAAPGEEGRAAKMAEDWARLSPQVRLLDAQETRMRAPMLKEACVGAGVWDPDCAALDVHGLHSGFLRGARSRGAQIKTDARVSSIERRNGRWRVATGHGDDGARTLVNAAGAWGDEIAEMAGVAPVGLVPKRRTVVTFPPEGVEIAPDWPLVIDLDEQWYFKPESGAILASPADETPSPPMDIQAEEMDIAIAIDRVTAVTGWTVRRVLSKWAGLRTFAPDRTPVIGFAPGAESFIWVCGQGGYGIQTAPAVSELIHALASGDDTAPVDAATYDPARLL